MRLQREHPLFLALLLILAAASWVMLIWQSSRMNSMGMGLTMGMGVNPQIKLVEEYNYSGGFWLSVFSALLA